METLTWSEASHSDRFLQGRVEFSFSSHVPSRVQNRYTCPCSTARSKISHWVNERRTCLQGKVHRSSVQVPSWQMALLAGGGSHSVAGGASHQLPACGRGCCCSSLRPGSSLQRDQTVHTPELVTVQKQQQAEIVIAIFVKI